MGESRLLRLPPGCTNPSDYSSKKRLAIMRPESISARKAFALVLVLGLAAAAVGPASAASCPDCGLTADTAGNLYGTTTAGGSSGNGTVFKLVKPTVVGGGWKEQVLYSFGTGTDGAVPVAGVILDASGNLYGTTSAGGTYGYGTVFQLKRSTKSYTEIILHEFALGTDGGVPYAGLVMDSKGTLYGAASDGGGGLTGGRTVFALT